MNENYIVINGKRAELTKEQLKQLGIVTEKSPFARVGKRELFYFISSSGRVDCATESYPSDGLVTTFFNTANYCTDKAIMEQRALHETLNRLLWRYSMEHKSEIKDGKKYIIRYIADISEIGVCWDFEKYKFAGENVFDTYKTAENAIEEIVKPFMKEHPEFVW